MGFDDGGDKRLHDITKEASEATISTIRENTEELKRNTTEIKKFNRSSSILSGAMIFLGVISLIISGTAFYFQFMALSTAGRPLG